MGMTLLGAIIIGVLAGLCKSEVEAWIPTFASWIRSIAARRLPARYRERYLEEWQANLDELPGPLSKLTCALGFCFAAVQIAVVDQVRRWGWLLTGTGIDGMLLVATGSRLLATRLTGIKRSKLRTDFVASFFILDALGLCFATLSASMWRINNFSSGDEGHKEGMRNEVRKVRDKYTEKFSALRAEAKNASGPWG